MNIAIIGAGYVGLVSAAVFAKLGHRVFALEINDEKLRMLKKGRMPFYEPDLEKLLHAGVLAKKLIFTNDYAMSIPQAEAIFLCVGTPMRRDGTVDLSQVFSAARRLAPYIKKDCVVVMKSTVPVGTTEKVGGIINKNGSPRIRLALASCPEFLREGRAVENTLHPDRIVIGTETPQAQKILINLHKKLPGERVLTDIRTAEMIKYASNAFLATKISFINEIANLCEGVGANVDDVALGMGTDPRIGTAFLRAGIGYGGSCFPKDTRALHSIAFANRYDFKLLKAVIEVNQLQRERFKKKIQKTLGSLSGKKIGVLGLAFKNNTDDIRESAAIDIVQWLMKEGATVIAYDPKAMPNVKKNLPSLPTSKTAAEIAVSAYAILILTEWQEFKKLPWNLIKKLMKKPLVIDGRNLLNPKVMKKLGFQYISVGRQSIIPL